MKTYKKQTPSQSSLDEAMTITKGTQKSGQTKEQSRLIAQGIAKGIEQYKKQQKAKAREKDKQRKKINKSFSQADTHPTEATNRSSPLLPLLPWGLLVVSWLGFLLFTLKA